MTNSIVNREFNNIIPQEISSEVKLTKHITMRAIITVVGVLAVTSQFDRFVHPKMKLLYSIVCILVGILAVIPAGPKNDGKLLYEVILLSLKKDRKSYHPIEYLEIEEEYLNE